MIFPPAVCHRHTGTHCMAGTGDSVDGVVTCCRLDSQIQPWWQARDFLSLIPVWTNPGALFTVGNCPLSWEHSSRGMELFTHPNVVLILRTSIAISLLLLCATIGMLLSDRFLIHVCG